ncbi:ABC transporter ATP-binding protein, partial [Enterococcus faecalis]
INLQHIYTKRLVAATFKIDVANREAQKEERRRVEQEYRENHKAYYDENGRVYNLHAISATLQVALQNGGAE